MRPGIFGRAANTKGGSQERDTIEIERLVGRVNTGAFNERKFLIGATCQNGSSIGWTKIRFAHGPAEELHQKRFGCPRWSVADEQFSVDLILR